VNVGGFAVFSLLYSCIVSFKHTLSVTLLVYGKMWQKGAITVPGGSFVCHGAVIVSEDSKISLLLLMSNSWTHIRFGKLEQNVTNVYLIYSVFICNCLCYVCSV